MDTNLDKQFTAIIRYGLFSIHKISGLKNDISKTISVNVHVLYTFTKCLFITSILTFANTQLSISKILGNCLKQETDFTRQKPKMETVLFLIFSILEIILTNSYVHYDYSNLKNRTIVRKTVPYSTIFRREISTKLQDKHREFAVKYYAKFMNTNTTIVFQFINYGGEARSPRQIMQNTIRGIMANTIRVFAQWHWAR